MSEYARIGVDTSKSVFTLRCVDGSGGVVKRRELKRGQFAGFFERLSPCEVVLEACGGSHHWARRLAGFGHRVKLIPPQYVKPFVKRGKNDRADAEAICVAAAQPGMRFVPVKSAAGQAAALTLKLRGLLVAERTRLVNALRGHAGEFGVVAGVGVGRVSALLEKIASDPAVPGAAKEMLAELGEEIARLEARIEALEARVVAEHKANPVSVRLAAVPGIGPIGALSLALEVEAAAFASGRHFAAWLGLTPRDRSTGGKRRLGGISRAGHARLRQLLVLGATAVIRTAKPGGRNATAWLLDLLGRKPRKLAAVALANKMARIVWAMMARGEEYRRSPVAA